MNEHIINRIVDIIMADPSIKALLQGGISGRPEQPEALILVNYHPELPSLLTRINELLGPRYILRVLGSDMVMMNQPQLPSGMSWADPESCWQHFDFARIILPNCTPNTLTKIALGIRDNLICELIARGITEGCCIDMITDLGFTDKTPIAYRQLYEGYLHAVNGYGITIHTSLDTIGSSCLTAPSSRQETRYLKPSVAEPADNQVLIWNKKLMTEHDVVSIPANTVIKLASNSIISPLAKDRLKERGIKICSEGGITRDSGSSNR